MRAPLAVLAALALGACAGPPGPVADAEGLVRALAVAPGGARLDADGAEVAVPAPKGLCVSEEGMHFGADAAVVMLGGCDGGPAADGFIRMVSVSAGPLAPSGGRDATLAVMRAHLRDRDGWRDLGFGDGDDALRLTEAYVDEEALVFVLQPVGGNAGVLGARGRAVGEVRGRAAIATVAAGRAAAETPALSAAAASLMRDLRAANPPTPPAPAPSAPAPSD